jgi:hypothetical protein
MALLIAPTLPPVLSQSPIFLRLHPCPHTLCLLVQYCPTSELSPSHHYSAPTSSSCLSYGSGLFLWIQTAPESPPPHGHSKRSLSPLNLLCSFQTFPNPRSPYFLLSYDSWPLPFANLTPKEYL